jgi:hypothetical protein
LKINVYFIFLNIGDLTFGITLVARRASYIIIHRAVQRAVGVLRVNIM